MCRSVKLAIIRKMNGQVLRSSAGDYQEDERAGVARSAAIIRQMSGQVLRGSADDY